MQRYILYQQYDDMNFCSSINMNEKEVAFYFESISDVYEWIRDEIDFIHVECPQTFIPYDEYEKEVSFTSWDNFLGRNCIFKNEEKEIIDISSNQTFKFIPISINYNLFDNITLYRWIEKCD